MECFPCNTKYSVCNVVLLWHWLRRQVDWENYSRYNSISVSNLCPSHYHSGNLYGSFS